MSYSTTRAKYARLGLKRPIAQQFPSCLHSCSPHRPLGLCKRARSPKLRFWHLVTRHHYTAAHGMAAGATLRQLFDKLRPSSPPTGWQEVVGERTDPVVSFQVGVADMVPCQPPPAAPVGAQLQPAVDVAWHEVHSAAAHLQWVHLGKCVGRSGMCAGAAEASGCSEAAGGGALCSGGQGAAVCSVEALGPPSLATRSYKQTGFAGGATCEGAALQRRRLAGSVRNNHQVCRS